ncbi:hypothetical protein [uncultured Corynebacterium sp.]|uniref:hypothetical protein n=1 Tax=uncultured Corynebacterium sp. TaxID=159447 RepID=UPI00259B0A50|nr:hypothetical protein [uncultured Corynebacterium sp.]
MAWVRDELDGRTKRLNTRFRNTYHGWSIALSIVQLTREGRWAPTRYQEGYRQALLDMCADGLLSADDFEALEEAAQIRANEAKERGHKWTP